MGIPTAVARVESGRTRIDPMGRTALLYLRSAGASSGGRGTGGRATIGTIPQHVCAGGRIDHRAHLALYPSRQRGVTHVLITVLPMSSQLYIGEASLPLYPSHQFRLLGRHINSERVAQIDFVLLL